DRTKTQHEPDAGGRTKPGHRILRSAPPDIGVRFQCAGRPGELSRLMRSNCPASPGRSAAHRDYPDPQRRRLGHGCSEVGPVLRIDDAVGACAEAEVGGERVEVDQVHHAVISEVALYPYTTALAEV